MNETMVRFLRELKFATRSLSRTKSLSLTVIVTLALGIGANTAVFTLLRGVLLRPLVNRDESRLIYLRQLANGRNATFSVPEIADLSSRMKTLRSFGDFSVISFTMVGLGEPRTVRAGVVSGLYFETIGLRPVLGRLIDAQDDGPKAAGVVVLTYRFWATAFDRDPSVIGKQLGLGADSRPATVVGVLEPSVPYPQETEIIANVVTSPHHLSATMVTGRIHRMTDLFARLSPGADMKMARAELESVYAAMKREHPEAYPAQADFHVTAMPLRDELVSGVRAILLVLMYASVLVFIIACANVANLILARGVRRQNELALRSALGATTMDLRRILLAESVLLCTAGAAAGFLIAGPLATVLARYAARFSVRALDLKLDPSALWVGAGLALVAAVLLAFVPRLPSASKAPAFGRALTSPRMTGTNRKLKALALVQIAASFVLVSAAAAAVTTLLSLQSLRSRFETHRVLAVNVPAVRGGRTSKELDDYYKRALQQIRALPGVQNAAYSGVVPWRDDDYVFEFAPDGRAPAPNETAPQAAWQGISPCFAATLGVPMLEGRDFTDADRDGERVVIVSETLARRMFPNGAVNHSILFTDPVLQFAPGGRPKPQRIIGVIPDIDNGNVAAQPTMTVYSPGFAGGRLLVDARTDPYSLVQPITGILRNLNANQPVERASTLEDIRAEVIAPTRLNVVVSTVFAGLALLIAVVGVAGVLMFLVSSRTREFGIRLALGSQPRGLLLRVIGEGVVLALGGLALGLLCGYVVARVGGIYLVDLKLPGLPPLAGSALVLLLSAVTAAAIPAARAARVDVMQVLRSE